MTTTAPTSTAPTPAGAAAAGGLRTRDVADLTLAAGYPSISVLLPTSPAPRMTLADVELLQELVREVRRQLVEQGVPATDRLMRGLTELAQRAVEQPTDRGLAIYVSLAVSRTFRLATPVRRTAVVEQTFATRELVHALHRTPPHAVLVLHPGCAHLYQAMAGSLQLVGQRDLLAGAAPVPAESDGDVADAFLRDVDRMLGGYRAEHPSPLVLAGSAATLDRFVSASRHLHRLAGRVAEADAVTPVALARASAALLEEYLRSRRAEALDTLAEALRSRPGDVARGMAECWTAVHQAQPLLLLVEEDFVSPGSPERDGEVAPPEGPAEGQVVPVPRRDRVHDLVDDLIEIVILRGGQLALVGNGELAGHGRVALVNRPGGGGWRGPRTSRG